MDRIDRQVDSARKRKRGRFPTSFMGNYMAWMILFRSSSVISSSAVRPHFWQIAVRSLGYQNICWPGLISKPQEHFPGYRAVSQNGSLALCFRRLLMFLSFDEGATVHRSPS